MYTRLMEPDQISHMQSMVAEERLHKSGERSYPQTFMADFQSYPAILAAIGHRFTAQKKIKIKNADVRLWDDTRRDQKPDFFSGLMLSLWWY